MFNIIVLLSDIKQEFSYKFEDLKMNRYKFFLIIILCISVLNGCFVSGGKDKKENNSEEPYFIEAKLLPEDEPVKPETTKTTPTPKVPVVKTPPIIKGGSQYLIGAGDILKITVWKQEDLSGEYIVSGKGMISMPLIGEVKAEKENAHSLAEKIRIEYKTYLVKPHVKVTFKEYNSSKITVMGEFVQLKKDKNTMQMVTLDAPTKISDIIAHFGGVTEDANTEAIRIIRNKKNYEVSLSNWLINQNEHHNPLLLDGDIIEVKKRLKTDEKRVLVLGEIRKPGIITFKDSITIAEVAIKSSGYTDDTRLKQVNIIRLVNNKAVLIKSDMKSLLNKGDLSQNIALQDEDIVFFSKTPMGKLSVFLKHIAPLLTNLNVAKGISEQTFEADE